MSNKYVSWVLYEKFQTEKHIVWWNILLSWKTYAIKLSIFCTSSNLLFCYELLIGLQPKLETTTSTLSSSGGRSFFCWHLSKLCAVPRWWGFIGWLVMRQLCVAKWWWIVILWENNSIHRINLQRLGISLRQEMVKIPLCVCIKKNPDRRREHFNRWTLPGNMPFAGLSLCDWRDRTSRTTRPCVQIRARIT